jgi:hypothetical protein
MDPGGEGGFRNGEGHVRSSLFAISGRPLFWRIKFFIKRVMHMGIFH